MEKGVMFDSCPSGLYLNMFYGDAMTHIDHYQLKLYFICKEGVEIDGPKLEHVKDNYDAHIKILTKYACWNSLVVVIVELFGSFITAMIW